MPLRKLTRGELRNLILPCKQLDYALDALDREPYVFPNVPLREGVVERVRECAHAWTKGQVPDDELNKAIVGFCYLVRNYPEHPAFDRLEREGVGRGEIMQALEELSKGCKWDFDRKYGAVVVAPGWIGYRYDPVHLITAGEDVVVSFSGSSQYRVEKIIVEVLEEAKQHFLSTGLLDSQSMYKLEHRLRVWRTRFEHPACEE